MLLLNFMIMLLLLIGLACTLAPRLHGTMIIGGVVIIYAFIIGVDKVQPWLGLSLFLCVVIAEVGALGLRSLLTNHFRVTRVYSVNTTVCNLAGIIVADALLGSFFGMLIWEGLVGKNLFPRLEDIGGIFMRLMIIGVVRLLCGVTMIILVIKYMMYAN